MKKHSLFFLPIFLLLYSCSNENTDDAQALRDKNQEYEKQIISLKQENNTLKAQRDSLNNIVENVKKWLND